MPDDIITPVISSSETVSVAWSDAPAFTLLVSDLDAFDGVVPTVSDTTSEHSVVLPVGAEG
jgi:hypothetical protein